MDRKGSADLVSVIVPFLNGSDWLMEALKSVLKQTHENWELIVIDDGSEECHSRIARSFCEKHSSKALYVDHEGHVNRGVTISRNEAVQFARGDYFAFLDADDVWLPNKLADQIAQFNHYPDAQVVCESMIMWHSWADGSSQDCVQQIGAPADRCYAPGLLNKMLYPFHIKASPAPSGIIIRKEAFLRINGFEPSFSGIYELYEDQAFLSKLYLQEVVYISGSANVKYRKRTDSMSSAANDIGRYHAVRAFYFDWLENYLAAHEIDDPELNMLIDTAKKELVITLPETGSLGSAIVA